MTDYFENYSFAVEETPERLTRLEDLLLDTVRDDAGDDTAVPASEYQRQGDGSTLWIYADEGNDAHLVAAAIAAWQTEFNLTEPVSFMAAYTASRPVDDAYGGGAFFIHRGRVASMDTSQWVREQTEGKRRPASPAEIQAARDQYQDDDIRVDEDAQVSQAEPAAQDAACDHGQWVSAWVYVQEEEAEGAVCL